LDSSSTHVDNEAWMVDSGASFHMTPHREWFYEYERYVSEIRIKRGPGLEKNFKREKKPSKTLLFLILDRQSY
jgi:hypothetical protein